MSHVFISYNHDDLDFAENVQSRLTLVGIETWMDHHIHPGDEWRTQIDQAIKDAFAMIVIMTPEAKASEYVTYEWSFAVGLGIRIIPLKYKPTPLHPRLEAFQFLDCTSNVRPWERLVEEVQDAAKSPRSAPDAAIRVSTLSFIEQAKAALNGMDANVRKDAIATLAQANSSEAHEALLEALSHPVADVRQQAVVAISNIRYQAAVPRLAELLHDPVQDVRLDTICALGNIGDAQAMPLLLSALVQADLNEKLRIVWALRGIKDEAVVAALLAQYEDKAANVLLRESIINTLGTFDYTMAIPTLKNALHDYARNICISSCKALLQIGSQEAIHAIADALLAMSRSQCEVVLEALETLEGKQLSHLDKFIAHLDDVYQKHLPRLATMADREKHATVRRRVIWIFGVMKNNNAIPTLITSMDDEDLVVQQETVMAFKEIKDERSLPALMTILRWRLEDYDERILLYALQALCYVGNESIVPQLKAVLNEMLERSSIELSVRVIHVFGKFGNYDAIGYLRNVKTNISHKVASSETKRELIDAMDQAIDAIRARLY